MMETISQLNTVPLDGTSVIQKRDELKRYFINTWQTYDNLFSLINKDSAFYLRPEVLRHPLIFYFGHTATFYINKLILGKYIHQRVNEKLEAVCAVGVDEMSWDDLDSSHYDWPQVDEVRSYRKQVFELVLSLIDAMPLSLPIKQDSLAWVILMGCEHERIHIETSSVIMRMLDLEHLSDNGRWTACQQAAVAPINSLVNIEGGSVNLAKPDSEQVYGWDNEYGDCIVELESFAVSKMLVSNGEYLAFIEAGGYHSPQYWTEEGQNWLNYTKAQMPRFWLQKSGKYYQRNLLNEIELPFNWPVEVNYLEAKAFCNWKSEQDGNNTRLPTEAEWLLLRKKLGAEQAIQANSNLAGYASSCAVDEFKQGDLYDVVGNVWQWTESAIDGFNGFNVHPLYDDFSTPTFDGKHNLIKGGSWISTGNEITPYSRYAFRRHFYQHAGFRYLISSSPEIPNIEVTRYETNTDVCRQLVNHYGEFSGGQANLYYPAIIDAILPHLNEGNQKALDLGCKVGRLSFLLSRHFSSVDAVDFSARYIQHGVQLQQSGLIKFVSEDEGDIVNYHEVQLANLDVDMQESKLHFSQGDACNLKPIYRGYDLIVANNLLETLYDPAKFLGQIHQRLNEQSVLAIVTDYHWQESITPKTKWLSGIKVNGENVKGIDGLHIHLAQHFELVTIKQIASTHFINSRKQHLVQNELSIWRLKASL